MPNQDMVELVFPVPLSGVTLKHAEKSPENAEVSTLLF